MEGRLTLAPRWSQQLWALLLAWRGVWKAGSGQSDAVLRLPLPRMATGCFHIKAAPAGMRGIPAL